MWLKYLSRPVVLAPCEDGLDVTSELLELGNHELLLEDLRQDDDVLLHQPAMNVRAVVVEDRLDRETLPLERLLVHVEVLADGAWSALFAVSLLDADVQVLQARVGASDSRALYLLQAPDCTEVSGTPPPPYLDTPNTHTSAFNSPGVTLLCRC